MQQGTGADTVVAWPSAEVAVMGPDGAAQIIYHKELEAAKDPDEVLKQKTADTGKVRQSLYACCQSLC